MLSDLLINIGASVIYDFAKAIKTKAAKSETVQVVLKKLDASPTLHDFPQRYVEALVEFRFMQKSPAVMAFFREESIAQVFYDFYYGDEGKRNNESALLSGIAHCVEALKVGDRIAAEKVEVEAELKQFWRAFRQKVQESRTVREAEMFQALQTHQLTIENVEQKVSEVLNALQAQGKTNVEIAGQIHAIDTPGVLKTLTQNAKQIFNIGRIETAYFQISPEKTIPHHLTLPPILPEIFQGREDVVQSIRDSLLTPDSNLLLLVNGEGGIGKTSVAANYYQKYHQEYKHAAWVFSEGSIAEALLSLAPQLNLQLAELETAQRLEELLKVLANLPEPCLLVIDNANDLKDFNANYFKLQRCNNFHILFTTRINDYKPGRFIHIPALPQDRALEVFRTHYEAFEDSEIPSFQEVYKAVNGNTLVLELFAKNLNHFNSDLNKRYLLKDLKKDIEKGLSNLVQSVEVETLYQSKGELRILRPEDIIAVMYDISVLSEEGSALLAVFAVLPAETIPFNQLKGLLYNSNGEETPKYGPEHEIDTHLFFLSKTGWIEYNKAEKAFKCSPVVQEVVRIQNSYLHDHCRPLIRSLIQELHREKIHEDNYRRATVYARYGAAAIVILSDSDEDLGWLCQNLGNFYSTIGDLDKAMEVHQKMEGVFSSLYEAYPQNVDFKNGLAISYSKLGLTHTSLGNLQQALTFFEDYNSLEKELYEADPQNVNFKNGLAISYSKLGETHTSLGNLQQALTFFEQDIELTKELYEADPQNVNFKNGLAISYSKLGETHTSLGNLQQALTFFEQDIELTKELYEADPQNVNFKNGLAISYSKLGETHTSLGNLQQALTFFEDYSSLEKELYEAYPQNVAFKNGLAISYEKLGSTHTSLGNLQQALTFFEQDIELTKELYEAYPQNVDFKNGLAISYEKLGSTHTSLGNLQQALTFFEDYNSLEKELYEAYPQNVAFKNGLAVSYSQLGRFYRDHKKDKQKAKIFFEQCRDHWKELSGSFPDFIQFQNYYRWAENALSELERKPNFRIINFFKWSQALFDWVFK